MDVCIITESFYSGGGGLTTFASRLAQSLRSKGVMSVVVTRDTRNENRDRSRNSKLPVYSLPPAGNSASLKYLFLPVLFAWLIVNKDKYDAMLVAGCRVTGVPSVIAAMLLRKPCLLRPAATGEISGTVFLDHPLIARIPVLRPVVKLLIRLRNRLFAWGASCGVAISKQLENELLQAGFPPNKIVRIENGVPTNRFAPTSADVRRSLAAEKDLDPDCSHAVYVGSLVPRKRVDVLLRAWAKRKQCNCGHTLLLVGPADTEQFQNDLLDLARTLDIRHSVRFVGYVDDVRPHLACADVFLMASQYEGMSNALLEAMACGLVPVVTDVSGAAEVIHTGENGFLIQDNDNIDSDFASMLDVLLHDPERCRKLGESARKTIEKCYSLQAASDKYTHTIKDRVKEKVTS